MLHAASQYAASRWSFTLEEILETRHKQAASKIRDLVCFLVMSFLPLWLSCRDSCLDTKANPLQHKPRRRPTLPAAVSDDALQANGAAYPETELQTKASH